MLDIDIERVLDGPARPSDRGRREIGRSREGRPLFGYRLGHGPRRLSLIAGCHADEPIGPAMLDRLAAWLQSLDHRDPRLEGASWRIVPHTNPDGEAKNDPWTAGLGPVDTWTSGEVVVELESYLHHVVRESPGEDLEFGFPRSSDDLGARPEARAIAAFLHGDGPYDLHGSFHGMAFAAGPWFLIERAWIDRTLAMRESLREQVASRGYTVHDIDRRGDKGFERIDRGFTTRPDSQAMQAHFKALGDEAMASLFRPSSMEFVRSLGGDCFTMVSEMPLFLLPQDAFPADRPVHVPATKHLRLAAGQGSRALAQAVEEEQVRAMPIRDQIYFQLAFLDAALGTIDSEAKR